MDKKRCNKCEEVKPLDEFGNWNKGPDGKQYLCKVCFRAYYREHYKNNPKRRKQLRAIDERKRQEACDYIDNIKSSTPCTDCGVKYPPYVMDFDHLGEKSVNVSKMRSARWSKRKLEQEIAKCEVVCSNCHRIRTHERLQRNLQG